MPHEQIVRTILDRISKSLEFFAVSSYGSTGFDVGVAVIDNVDPVVYVCASDSGEAPSKKARLAESGGGDADPADPGANRNDGGQAISGAGHAVSGHAVSGVGHAISESETPILDILYRGLRA